MFVPTAIATQLAADSVASRRGAARSPRTASKLTLPHPIAALRARRAAQAAPCAAC